MRAIRTAAWIVPVMLMSLVPASAQVENQCTPELAPDEDWEEMGLCLGMEGASVCDFSKFGGTITYSISPDKDALLTFWIDVGPRTPPEESMTSSEDDLVNVELVRPGILYYSAEVKRKVSGLGGLKYTYCGEKTGFSGYGLGWDYGDGWDTRVICYEAAAIDAGQVACETWADKSPIYSTASAELSVVLGRLLTCKGVAYWDAVPPPAALLWVGDMAGEIVTGAPVGCGAKMIGFL